MQLNCVNYNRLIENLVAKDLHKLFGLTFRLLNLSLQHFLQKSAAQFVNSVWVLDTEIFDQLKNNQTEFSRIWNIEA